VYLIKVLKVSPVLRMKAEFFTVEISLLGFTISS